MTESIGHKAVSGTMWATVDRFSAIVLQFVVNLVLANLLTPADYGVVGVLAIFISVSNTLTEGGFASALIQRKYPTQTDYSTIFFWNAGFSFFCYAVLFLAAPLVARFFSMPELSPVLRVLGLSIVGSALGQVQLVRLKKDLNFKIIAIVNLSSYITSSAVGIYMAYTGFSYWSLVIMTVLNQLTMTGLYWILSRWRPSAVFSILSFRTLFGYGGYLLAAGFLQEVCRNLQGVIIGKRFSKTQLGLYSQADKLDKVTSYAIPQVLVQVLFPLFSNIQDDKPRMCAMIELGIRVISAIVFPILLILIIIAEKLIGTLYGMQWLPCVPYFRILCAGGLFVCLQNINFYAVAACGQSKPLFRWSFYKWTMLVVLMLVGMLFGMEGLIWSIVASNINIYLVNAFLARRYVGLKLRSQLLAILPPFVAALAAAAAVYFLDISWLLKAGLYVVLYAGIVFVSRMRVLKDLTFVLSRLISKKKR